MDKEYKKNNKGKKVKKDKKEERKRNIIVILVFVVFMLITGISVYVKTHTQYDHAKWRDKTVCMIENTEIKLYELNYYIMIEEETVDEMARAYDEENPRKYWNVYMNHTYVSTEAREFVKKYFLRDYLFALKAKKSGMTLSEDEANEIEERSIAIFEGLTEKQIEAGIKKEDIYEALFNNALSDKFVIEMANKDGRTLDERVISAYYGINSYYYKNVVKEYNVKWKDNIIDKVKMGMITIN